MSLTLVRADRTLRHQTYRHIPVGDHSLNSVPVADRQSTDIEFAHFRRGFLGCVSM